MNRLFLALVLSAATACSKSQPTDQKSASADAPANNPMTRYVSDLQSDVGKARSAADKMNESIKQGENKAKELESAGD